MKKKPIIIILLFITILIVIGIIWYFWPSKYITSTKCKFIGGEITQYKTPEVYDPYNPPEPICQDNKKNFGHISDIDCNCICCK